MRFAVILIVAFACSVAFASEPGQPLDCSDMTFDVPGLSCRVFAPFGVPSTYGSYFTRGSNISIDTEGSMLIAVATDTNGSVEVRRTRDGGMTDERLAKITLRCVTNPTYCDKIMVQWPSGASALDQRSIFDPVNGRLLIPLTSHCEGADCPGNYGGGQWIAAIEGFSTLFEVLESYVTATPTALSALGFHVPVMPEGMPAADHFDTYWGVLTKPLDFTQAQPLQCGHPTAPPHVGDYLTVADTVPTPAPGQGVYYVTSATHQGQTRYGRKTTAGHLTGRDPAVLPVCASPSDNGPIPIDAPTTITQPGSYILTRSMSGVINIQANNVVLNLNGFQLDGAIDGATYFTEIFGGRLVNGGINLMCYYCTIRDLTVRDSPGGVFLEGNHNIVEHTRHFSSHIYLDDAVGGIVRDNVVQSGYVAIESGSAFQVTHNAITDGYIWLDGDDKGVVLDNMVTGSPTHGIFGLGWGNRIAGNVVSASAGFGLYLESNDNPPGNTYSANVCRGNHGTGCANPSGNADFCDEGMGNESGGDNFMPDLR